MMEPCGFNPSIRRQVFEIQEGGEAAFDERAAPAHSDVGAIVPPHWSQHSTIRLPAWYARFGCQSGLL